jgi:hypothetical protein
MEGLVELHDNIMFYLVIIYLQLRLSKLIYYF